MRRSIDGSKVNIVIEQAYLSNDNQYTIFRYKHNAELEEEYIDLATILKKIYIDSDEFLKPIKKVSVLYD